MSDYKHVPPEFAISRSKLMELAKIITHDTIRKWVKRGYFKEYRRGGNGLRFYDRREVERYLFISGGGEVDDPDGLFRSDDPEFNLEARMSDGSIRTMTQTESHEYRKRYWAMIDDPIPLDLLEMFKQEEEALQEFRDGLVDGPPELVAFNELLGKLRGNED